jgi:hypothetical protein
MKQLVDAGLLQDSWVVLTSVKKYLNTVNDSLLSGADSRLLSFRLGCFQERHYLQTLQDCPSWSETLKTV